MTQTLSRLDIYTRITDKIVADLEQGVRPWLKPWSVEHAADKISRPLRYSGIPYNGITLSCCGPPPWRKVIPARIG
jgi:antirestriction protein ArdC